MGLDQYWKITKVHSEDIIKPVEDDEDEISADDGMEGLYYHRKRHALEGFMQELAQKKGFSGEFNCVYVKVGYEDLKDLLKRCEDKSLKDTRGFFFGSRTTDEQDYKEIKDAANKALVELNNGYTIYYTSWW